LFLRLRSTDFDGFDNGFTKVTFEHTPVGGHMLQSIIGMLLQ